MSNAITTKYKFTLSSKQEFEVTAHYRDVPAFLKSRGTVPVAYIETLSTIVPNVKGAEIYHVWKMANGSVLTAWYIPETSILSAVPIDN